MIVTDKRRHIKLHEYNRTTGFVLALIIVAACMFAAFEYNSGTRTDDEQTLDDIEKKLDMMEADRHNDMFAAEMPQPEKKVPVSENIKVVENESEEQAAEQSQVKPMILDDEKPETQDAEITKVIPPSLPNPDAAVDIHVLEQLPEFPGGMSAFVKWLTDRLQYPSASQQKRITGKVVVSFIINIDGTVTDLKVDKSVSPELDAEAMRVLKMMPRWKPGKLEGKPCRTMFAIPVVFQL